MSTTIKYQNIKEEFVTAQQALQLNEYLKLFFIDNNLKKRERYFDNELWGGVYYLSDNESPTDVLTELGANLKWSFCVNEEIINGYTVFEYRSYDKNLQLEPKYNKNIKDPSGKVEAYVGYSTDTNEPISAFKVFNMGGLQVPNELEGILWEEDATITFSIDENGVYDITMNYDWINNDSQWRSLEDFQIHQWFVEAMFPGDMLAYFASLDLVPNF